jgi:DNA polymerase III subunit epsilon
MIKTLYFDCETGGVDPKTCGLLQLAALVDIDGEIKEEFCSYVQPFPSDIVLDEALEVNKIKREHLQQFPEPKQVYKKFIAFLDKYIDRYNSCDKFYPAGYNIRFDREVMESFARRCGDGYFGSYVSWKFVDALPVMTIFDWMGKTALANYKLGTVCAHYNIEIPDAHDAMADIRATRNLIIKVRDEIKGNDL